ncbi:MAG: hypothetical protein FWF57_00575 [Defluviitaleaceae bacterium]|nr:hypothetical protein [Defluviitaleaceae bacterium]
MNRDKWENFIDDEVKNFFEKNNLSNLIIKDNNGNKSKITVKVKTGEIKIENSYEKTI